MKKILQLVIISAILLTSAGCVTTVGVYEPAPVYMVPPPVIFVPAPPPVVIIRPYHYRRW